MSRNRTASPAALAAAFTLSLCVAAPTALSAQPAPLPETPLAEPRPPLLRSGPMLGYAEIQEVAVWLQTTSAARVQLRYWEQGRPETARSSAEVATGAASDHIARFTLAGLAFGTTYDYEVLLDGAPMVLPYPTRFTTQPMWRWRTEPPPLRFALASCFYVNDPAFDRPGTPYGSEHEILAALLAKEPQMMLWLGDNVYLREADWTTEAGTRARYAHTRAFPGLQPLLARVPSYATWDDHDFGADDADRSFRGRDTALRVFRDYWANPAYGRAETPGVYFRFEWGDVELFVVDDRFHRSPGELLPSPEKHLLGPGQMRWLQESLRSSAAPFKFVVSGSQVLSERVPERPSLAGGSGIDGWRNYPHELDELLDFIRRERIPGVLFLSGDAHFSELTRLQPEGLYPLYDLTSSPLTAGPTRRDDLEVGNPGRVPGTLVRGHSFAMVEVIGAKGDRRASLAAFDVAGNERWRHEIHERELTFDALPQPTPSAAGIEEEEIDAETGAPDAAPLAPTEPSATEPPAVEPLAAAPAPPT